MEFIGIADTLWLYKNQPIVLSYGSCLYQRQQRRQPMVVAARELVDLKPTVE